MAIAFVSLGTLCCALPFLASTAGCLVHMCWLRLALPFRYSACHHARCFVSLLSVGALTLLQCACLQPPTGACPSCRHSQSLMPVLHRLHPGAHSCLPLLTMRCHLSFFLARSCSAGAAAQPQPSHQRVLSHPAGPMQSYPANPETLAAYASVIALSQKNLLIPKLGA